MWTGFIAMEAVGATPCQVVWWQSNKPLNQQRSCQKSSINFYVVDCWLTEFLASLMLGV